MGRIDPGVEELLCETESVRRICALWPAGALLTESMILPFRHPLQRRQLGEALLETINAHLGE